MWKRVKILLTVKTYPEMSKKHGSVVCTAGITEDGDWIRMYPIPFERFRGGKTIPKYSWIEVECKKVEGEILGRKESHKIRPSSVKVVDDSLTVSPVDWEARNDIVLSMKNESIERLDEMYDEDRTSLGLVKPFEVFDFYSSKDLEEFETGVPTQIQKTIEGEERQILEILPHVFRYRFCCNETCKSHDMTCEDWELLQSFRSWRLKYDGPELWEKLYNKYFYEFTTKRDLHFYMGMHSRYRVWMIIGLYYPPGVR